MNEITSFFLKDVAPYLFPALIINAFAEFLKGISLKTPKSPTVVLILACLYSIGFVIYMGLPAKDCFIHIVGVIGTCSAMYHFEILKKIKNKLNKG